MASQSSHAPALSGKVAIVTGGGTGIGLAIARMFVEEGAQVVIAGRSQAALDKAAAEIGAHATAADVSQEADAAKLARETAARFGGVDILVNNAGVTGQVANAEDLDIAQWDETMAINIRGTILCIKHCVPLMRARGGGSIINMSSLMGLRGYPMRSAYTATKFAVIGITQAVAQEAGIHGIRVNALCPGAVNGELMQRVIAARAAKENRPAEEIIQVNYTDKAALKRWVEPEEVARAALFLASEQSSSITSESIKVDAGRM
jgi:NAD(P)-dependent dehydrogenase (short-subunit alcohol dehydrogenase family)